MKISNKSGIIFFIALFIGNTNCFALQEQLQECLNFYNKIYQIMEQEYYQDVSAEEFEKFISEAKSTFNPKRILEQDELGRIKYHNARVLVHRLKDPQDYYTSFRAAEEAKKFEADTYAYEKGLGIEGELIEQGFKVNWVEPRSDSFAQGIRENDIILQINAEFVKGLTHEQIVEKLRPELGAKVSLRIISDQDKQEKLLVITCREFYRKTSFLITTGEPDIFCIKIKFFNQMILEDLNEIFDQLRVSGDKRISGIILDFRDNQGGITDIVENLAGYFMAAGNKLFYVNTKSQGLKEFFSKQSYCNYRGPLVALMNEQTRSSAELLLGSLRTYDRTILLGQNSSGSGKLKRLIRAEDGAWNILLVTSLFYLSDGSTFDNAGLKPDYEIVDNEQALSQAVDILIERRQIRD